MDIAQIEASHATNRETTMMRARGWFCSLAVLSSKFITRVMTKLGLAAPKQPEESKPTESEGASSGIKPKRSAGGGGGAWRAFVHQHAKGTQFGASLMSELSERYRSLTHAERQKYEEAGRAATMAHKAGYSSFVSESKTASQKVRRRPRELEPGDIQPGTGAIVTSDYFDYDALMRYTGPDFFMERYDELKARSNLEAKEETKLETLTKEERQELESFQATATSEEFLKDWCDAKYSSLTSAFCKMGIGKSNLLFLQWVPPLISDVKARFAQNIGCMFVLVSVHFHFESSSKQQQYSI